MLSRRAGLSAIAGLSCYQVSWMRAGREAGCWVTHLPLGAVSWVMLLLVRRLQAAYSSSRRSVSYCIALLTVSRWLAANPEFSVYPRPFLNSRTFPGFPGEWPPWAPHSVTTLNSVSQCVLCMCAVLLTGNSGRRTLEPAVFLPVCPARRTQAALEVLRTPQKPLTSVDRCNANIHTQLMYCPRQF